MQAIQDLFYWVYGDAIRSFSLYFPSILGAILILIFGSAIAKFLSRVFVRILQGIKLNTWVAGTPIEHFLIHTETKRLENALGSVVYWLLMILVLQLAAATLGLEPLTYILASVLSYVPKVLSAVVILFVGILLAGLVENLVKATIRSIDGKSSRLFGKISSYLVMAVVVLAAISELGIASDFILVLFIGLVATLSLGFGLAFGLGAQDIVRRILESWYEKISEE